MLGTTIQRDIRSVVSIRYFILDFYFSLPNFGSPVYIKSSLIGSSNIKKRFQSKKFQKHQFKDISEFLEAWSSAGNNIFGFSIFSTKSRKFCSKSSHLQPIRQIYLRRRCCCCYSTWISLGVYTPFPFT